jgi:hypothetical protein
MGKEGVSPRRGVTRFCFADYEPEEEGGGDGGSSAAEGDGVAENTSRDKADKQHRTGIYRAQVARSVGLQEYGGGENPS